MPHSAPDTLTNDNDKTQIAAQDTLLSELRKASDCEACLIVVRGEAQGKRYELSRHLMILGRDNSSDIVLNDPKVSRRQALIRKQGDKVMLIDGGSTNGTFINDHRLSPHASAVLEKEDMIRIGNTVLKYLPRGALEIRYIGMLEARANTDPLTKVYNKGYLLDALHAEFKRARALETPLSVLFLDIDHFKQINDTYGHDAGDRVLVETCTLLRNAVSINRGVLGRFGGEEFVALLPGHNLDAAASLAEFTRNTIEKHLFPLEDRQIHLTVSIGIAGLSSDMTEAMDLVKLADKAVYLAKNGGRNRVCHA